MATSLTEVAVDVPSDDNVLQALYDRERAAIAMTEAEPW